MKAIAAERFGSAERISRASAQNLLDAVHDFKVPGVTSHMHFDEEDAAAEPHTITTGIQRLNQDSGGNEETFARIMLGAIPKTGKGRGVLSENLVKKTLASLRDSSKVLDAFVVATGTARDFTAINAALKTFGVSHVMVDACRENPFAGGLFHSTTEFPVITNVISVPAVIDGGTKVGTDDQATKTGRTKGSSIREERLGAGGGGALDQYTTTLEEFNPGSIHVMSYSLATVNGKKKETDRKIVTGVGRDQLTVKSTGCFTLKSICDLLNLPFPVDRRKGASASSAAATETAAESRAVLTVTPAPSSSSTATLRQKTHIAQLKTITDWAQLFALVEYERQTGHSILLITNDSYFLEICAMNLTTRFRPSFVLYTSPTKVAKLYCFDPDRRCDTRSMTERIVASLRGTTVPVVRSLHGRATGILDRLQRLCNLRTAEGFLTLKRLELLAREIDELVAAVEAALGSGAGAVGGAGVVSAATGAAPAIDETRLSILATSSVEVAIQSKLRTAVALIGAIGTLQQKINGVVKSVTRPTEDALLAAHELFQVELATVLEPLILDGDTQILVEYFLQPTPVGVGRAKVQAYWELWRTLPQRTETITRLKAVSARGGAGGAAGAAAGPASSFGGAPSPGGHPGGHPGGLPRRTSRSGRVISGPIAEVATLQPRSVTDPAFITLATGGSVAVAESDSRCDQLNLAKFADILTNPDAFSAAEATVAASAPSERPPSATELLTLLESAAKRNKLVTVLEEWKHLAAVHRDAAIMMQEDEKNTKDLVEPDIDSLSDLLQDFAMLRTSVAAPAVVSAVTPAGATAAAEEESPLPVMDVDVSVTESERPTERPLVGPSAAEERPATRPIARQPERPNVRPNVSGIKRKRWNSTVSLRRQNVVRRLTKKARRGEPIRTNRYIRTLPLSARLRRLLPEESTSENESNSSTDELATALGSLRVASNKSSNKNDDNNDADALAGLFGTLDVNQRGGGGTERSSSSGMYVRILAKGTPNGEAFRTELSHVMERFVTRTKTKTKSQSPFATVKTPAAFHALLVRRLWSLENDAWESENGMEFLGELSILEDLATVSLSRQELLDQTLATLLLEPVLNTMFCNMDESVMEQGAILAAYERLRAGRSRNHNRKGRTTKKVTRGGPV